MVFPMANMQEPSSLAGVTVALPEARELDRMAGILESAGASIWRCPLVAIVDAADLGPVDAWLTEFAQVGFDDLIILTGEGLRRLIARAQDLGLGETVGSALGKVRKITRGGKPARVLHACGLLPDLAVQPPTTEGVIATLAPMALREHRVGVQLYGTDPNERLVSFLTNRGAVVRPVAPYAYAPATHAGKVEDLIRSMAAGRVDVIAFTSASQVERLWHVSQERGVEVELRSGLARTRIAAIGPIVETCLLAHGARADIVPRGSFVMKGLTDAIGVAMTNERTSSGD
jgi:uroporphyrinogen-III synthase